MLPSAIAIHNLLRMPERCAIAIALSMLRPSAGLCRIGISAAPDTASTTPRGPFILVSLWPATVDPTLALRDDKLMDSPPLSAISSLIGG